jgi:hypothetical protein
MWTRQEEKAGGVDTVQAKLCEDRYEKGREEQIEQGNIGDD